MTIQSKLTATLLSFQILDSKSGNITNPPFHKEGNEINFDYDIKGNKAGITIASTTFYKKFFYRLLSKSDYEFEGENDALVNLSHGDLLTSLTEMSQYSFVRHSNIFKQFNYTGLFKYCALEEKTFEELYAITAKAFEINRTREGFITRINLGAASLQN